MEPPIYPLSILQGHLRLPVVVARSIQELQQGIGAPDSCARKTMGKSSRKSWEKDRKTMSLDWLKGKFGAFPKWGIPNSWLVYKKKPY